MHNNNNSNNINVVVFVHHFLLHILILRLKFESGMDVNANGRRKLAEDKL